MSAMARARAVISGRVQGVFFRAETRDTARRQGISGWVKNRSDGTVEAVFEGPRESVQAVLDWCRHGPSQARVESVQAEWEPASGEFDGFEIKR